MMSKTNIGLVEYAQAQLGKPYWYGTYGQLSTKSLYEQKKKQLPSYYKWNLKDSELNKKVHDCSGLIKGYLWCDDARDNTPKYNSNEDLNANTLLKRCTEKGDISTIPEIPGVLVFMTGHVGIYKGNGEVIEARGHSYGVVITKLKERKWTKWGKCCFITYNEPKPETPKIENKKSIDDVAKEVMNGKYGNGAERKQRIPLETGYSYEEVQAKVNELLKSSTNNDNNNSNNKLRQVALDVINGKYGNGTIRKIRLQLAGYNYNEVQSLVNELLRK